MVRDRALALIDREGSGLSSMLADNRTDDLSRM